MQDLEETYSNITLVQDETIWQEFIYKSSLLEEPADALDCSFICRNVEKSNGCDLFVMEVGKKRTISHDRDLIGNDGRSRSDIPNSDIIHVKYISISFFRIKYVMWENLAI